MRLFGQTLALPRALRQELLNGVAQGRLSDKQRAEVVRHKGQTTSAILTHHLFLG